MLPTFVIGLREGLEAALIVGIIAAFLRKQGRRDLVRWVFVGVGVAVLLCVGVGVTLDQLSRDLPQRQQEGLETVIGVLAVGMVSYMVIWMRRHSRELKGQLEGMATAAMDGTSRAARAMIIMAFLAVLREGFETVVFLLAAFNESGSNSAAGAGAVIGLAVAVVLGYGIYRGGVRLNLSKFFRATGLVLVLVAAGLVVNALHTAHEAAWLNAGQGGTVDLTWLVRPGSVQASLLTGMLGVQAKPVVIELIGWLLYLVPTGLYVAWPPGRGVPKRALAQVLAVIGAAMAAGAVTCVLLAPAVPARNPVTSAGPVTAQLLARPGPSAVVRTQLQSPAGAGTGKLASIEVRRGGADTHGGLATDSYTATVTGTSASALPPALGSARIAELNGGRLPIGLALGAGQSAPAAYRDRSELTAWVEPRTGRIIDLQWVEQITATVTGPGGAAFALARPLAYGRTAFDPAVVRAAVAAARPQLHTLDRRAALVAAAWIGTVAAGALLLAALSLALAARRVAGAARPADPVEALIGS